MTSAALKAMLHAEESGDALIVLVTISHADLAETLYVTSDSVNTVSRGTTFVPYPFDLKLTVDSPNEPPKASISISNVDKRIVESIRSITSPPTILIEIIRSVALDTVEVTYPNFELTQADYDAMVVSGDLEMENFFNEPYPSATYVRSLFPGVF